MSECMKMPVHMSCPYSLPSNMLRSLLTFPLPDWCERGWRGAAWWRTHHYVSGIRIRTMAPYFIHRIHKLRFVLSDCWTSMNNYWWQTPTPVVSTAIDTCPCSCGRWQLAKWPRYDLIREQNLVSIYPRCWVLGENVISLHWWPFWNGVI